MQSLREFLPPGFCEQMEKQLGREQTLKLLWPAIVGTKLAANTEPLSLSGDTLRVRVPDRVWQNSLESFEKQILDSAARFWGKPVAAHVEFVLHPPQSPPRPQAGELRRSP